ncbi:MHS family MFS transporter [Amycolatopsis acidiphila]|uniref:Putative proline/betaine transporter n=1 Tax=Amycolatopsis acidiphila TaxID=715473 RepID=A0A558A476_9PSEU|nr:MFS transporter [Amycolatopsis acidiphila]TVT19065.1 MHS family MFS transporter [Amycolatopsis acidiphila]UIJ63691.1 MHS family MFS transporter [Amycolatopsis acidiphila]GHG67426.1 MFS transporter [Amycolatopsis acidiphila]
MTGSPPSRASLLLASCVGTSIEWYDYYIFGSASALVFGSLFYPSFSPVASTLAAFGTFAVGFIARPLGGAVIGHFGDRIGRKAMLVLTLMMAGISTFLIGLLPGYATIGVAAPVLLVLLRLLQGFGVGGEWGGAVLMATEHAGPRRRAVFGSFAQFGVPIGVLTSNLVFLLASQLPAASFRSWGWRIPFLLSIVLLVVGMLVRRKLDESPDFRRVKETNRVSKLPFGTLVREQPGTLLLASVAAIAPPAVGYTVMVYMLNYGTAVAGFTRNTLLTLLLLSAVLWIVMIYFAARWADRWGSKRVYAIGALTAVAWAFPLFALVNTRGFGAALVAFFVAAVVQAIMAGAQGALFTELFHTRLRFSGASIAYQLGGLVGGAVTPLVATALFGAYHSSTPIALYLALVCALSLVAVVLLRVPASLPAHEKAVADEDAAPLASGREPN